MVKQQWSGPDRGVSEPPFPLMLCSAVQKILGLQTETRGPAEKQIQENEEAACDYMTLSPLKNSSEHLSQNCDASQTMMEKTILHVISLEKLL